MYGSESFLPLIQMNPCPSSRTVSPGRPTRRLTKVPPAPHAIAAWGGVLKTMMSPRFGLQKVKQNRHASTRSENDASHPIPGRAQCSVGSIELDGIRYGLITHCLIASTITIAPRIVTSQSI